MLDLAAALPAVISDTDAIYLHGLDTIGYIGANYTDDPLGLPLSGGELPNRCRLAARPGTAADLPSLRPPSTATLRNRDFKS
jgi:hypothetical protein